MAKLFQFPSILHEDVSYYVDESGLPTDIFKADLCEALSDCIGTGDGGDGNGGGPPVNENMPAPSLTSASDGQYATWVHLLWTAVVPPDGVTGLQYKIYRSLDTNSDPTNAVLIATVNQPVVEYDDATVVVGVIYNYWVVAANATYTSAFSNRNPGHASAPLVALDAITDLRTTQGHHYPESSPISLVFTPPAGAQRFDVYRHTANDFSAATKVIDNIEPDDATARQMSTNSPDQAWDNGDEMLIWHFPPSPTVHYFFWIISRASSPPAVSLESNAAEGWVRSNHVPYTGGTFTLSFGQSVTEGTDFTGTKIRVVLFSGGGGGAGGSQVYGGGGGGAGGVVVEEFVIPALAVLSLEAVDSVADTGNAAALADGLDGSTMTFKINGVAKMIADGGGGGLFNAAGSGAGGVGNSGSGTTAPTIYTGKSGNPGVGAAGGASGYAFGNRRYPAAWYEGFAIGEWDGNGLSPSNPGGGSYAAPGVEVLAVGGAGLVGRAVISFGV